MLKERIQEVFEFSKSESPYRKANKGWINQDIFLDLNPSSDTSKETNEAAKVTVFWSPINSLLSNIFIIIILGSILVFTSITFSKARFDFDLFNNSSIINNLKVEGNKSINISLLKDIDSQDSKNQQNIDKKDLSKPNNINLLDDYEMKADKKIDTKTIDNQESSIIETQSNKDIKVLPNKKPKSNFI